MAGYTGRGLHGQAVEEIGRRLVGGEITESETIDLVTLREQLGVSATALREALKVLAAKGLGRVSQISGS